MQPIETSTAWVELRNYLLTVPWINTGYGVKPLVLQLYNSWYNQDPIGFLAAVNQLRSKNWGQRGKMRGVFSALLKTGLPRYVPDPELHDHVADICRPPIL